MHSDEAGDRPVDISVIIPARNEERAIGGTLDAIRTATGAVGGATVEVILVDNLSTDRTAEIARRYAGVRCVPCDRLKAPCARNYGAGISSGRILVFVDADTRIPRNGLVRVLELAQAHRVGIFRICGDGNDFCSRLWWFFWNTVRHLPIAHAKALPAFMFCTREAFDSLGPFDESVVIGEEWPLTAECYSRDRRRFIYDCSTSAVTSDRRMALQRFGYIRTFFKYVWAVLHKSGRIYYADTIR